MIRRIASLLVWGTACAVPELSVTEVEQGLWCDDWMCGTNTNIIANRGFWDLRIDHLPNRQGFALETFEDTNGDPMELHVHEGRIRGKTTAGFIEGKDLEGAIFYVSIDGHELYAVRITEVEESQFWAAIDGERFSLETYRFDWSPTNNGIPLNEWQNTCIKPELKDNLGMNGYHSLVFEGERIYADKKSIDPVIDNRWFNFGCAGTALSKLHLLGHTQAAQAVGFSTTIPERQSMLKAITADYCGTGTALTVAGQPIDWAEEDSTLKFTPWTVLEARWTEHGASCLNQPRITATPTQLGQQVFPNINDAIETACNGNVPPPCAGTEFEGHHLLSGNPP